MQEPAYTFGHFKMKLLFCFIFGVFGLNQARYEFETWVKDHKKVYESEDEKQLRFANFQATLAKIDAINGAGLSWTAGLNKFSDMTWEEFKHDYLMQAGNWDTK